MLLAVKQAQVHNPDHEAFLDHHVSKENNHVTTSKSMAMMEEPQCLGWRATSSQRNSIARINISISRFSTTRPANASTTKLGTPAIFRIISILVDVKTLSYNLHKKSSQVSLLFYEYNKSGKNVFAAKYFDLLRIVHFYVLSMHSTNVID